MHPSEPQNHVSAVSLERRVHGLFLTGWAGGTLDPAVRDMLQRGLRGVALFAKNIESPTQTAALCRAIHEARGPGGIIGIDQEGGRVARLRDGFFISPPMAEVGRVASEHDVFDLGRLVGLQLKSLGINLNFAPVLDVDTNSDNPVIGNRAFAADPQRVAELGAALARGLQDVGVAACGKHFPGHGDTHQDSHHTLPRLPHDRARLDRVELLPFHCAIEQGIASIMSAHIVFESLNPSPEDDTPATMSQAVLTGLLRDELGFKGVVISDDLEMKAIADHSPIEEVAVRALEAGIDLLIACHHPELVQQAIDAVLSAVAAGRLAESVIDTAYERVETLAQQFAPASLDQPFAPEEAAAFAALQERLSAVLTPTNTRPREADPTDYLGAIT